MRKRVDCPMRMMPMGFTRLGWLRESSLIRLVREKVYHG